MAERIYYLRQVTTTGEGASFAWWPNEQYLAYLQVGDVALLNYKDSDEGTNEYHAFADESTSEPSFALEGTFGEYYSYYSISYNSTEEQNLIDRFGDLDLVDLSSAQAYVDSYMDGIVEQANTGAENTQFTNKKIEYNPTLGESSSLEGATTAGSPVSATMTSTATGAY
jgi:hypothetical protein